MYRLNEESMFFDMSEDQAIIIDSDSGVYYAMNMLASHVFEYITMGAGIKELQAALSQLPDCPEDIMIRLESFVAQLLADRIIVEDKDNIYEGDIEADVLWFMEGKELILESYPDMTELITADPVHDVDVEFGWPVLKDEDETNV